MSLGFMELSLILIIILLIFGAGKLPKVMGEVGKGIKNLKSSLAENSDIEEKTKKNNIDK